MSIKTWCLSWLFVLGAMSDSWAQTDQAKDQLLAVLGEHRLYPEFFDYLEKGKDTFPVQTRLSLSQLEPGIVQARCDEFNNKFAKIKAMGAAAAKRQAVLQSRFENTPLSDIKNKSALNLQLRGIATELLETRRTLFLISLDANRSLIDAFATVTPTKLKQIEAEKIQASAPKPPKMPGIYQGSEWEYQKQDETAKTNITPFDTEFKTSQLGQKIQRDLSGDVKFWSYDFDRDELYVSVNDQISKIMIREEENSDVRYLQTRGGAGFFTPKGADERVNEFAAKGKFMVPKSQKSNEETLFGVANKDGPKYLEERLPPGHSFDDGHGHKH